jgi:hypothetical protein
MQSRLDAAHVGSQTTTYQGEGMRKRIGRLAALLAALALGMSFAPAGFAGGEPGGGKPKCNSGNGNGSETTPADDCDPGNSGGHNNGGD